MRYLLPLSCFLILFPALVNAQAATRPAVKITAKQEDVATLDSILKAIYGVISGPAGQKRDWDRMRSLFVPGAQMGAAVRLKNGDIRHFGFDVEKYIASNDKFLTEKGFFETELHRHVDTFGNITQVFSTYESRWKPDDAKPFERGINSIQLVNDGRRWWVVSLLWQSEDDKLPIPAEWLDK